MYEQATSLSNVSEKVAVWRSLVPIILVSTAVKYLVAWRFPFTGDEAYLVLWGKYVASGYYDHPPHTWLASAPDWVPWPITGAFAITSHPVQCGDICTSYC